MKVLVVHNRYRSGSPSGENRVVDQESAALARAGHDVCHFERSSDDIDGRSLRGKALVPGQVVWSQSAATEMGRLLAGFKPDVVHVHNLFPLISPSVLRSCRRHLVPVVVTLHNYRLICPSGDLFRDGRTCHDCVGRRPVPAVRHGCYRGSAGATVPLAVGMVAHRNTWRSTPSAFVFISASQRDLHSSLDLEADRCFVKHNLVYPMTTASSQTGDTAPESAPKRSSETLVVYMGRMSDLKGIRLLMTAWELLEDEGRVGPGKLRLGLAGGGPLDEEVRRWAGSRHSVEFHGLLDRDGCVSLLSRASAAVVPSVWEEPFGLVVAEAMSAGVPSIAPSSGSFPELISEGVNGLLFEPGDPAGLARALCEPATDPERWDALGHKARLTYEQRFDPGANVRQLEAIYRFAIDHPVWLELRPGGTPKPGGNAGEV